MRVPWKSLLLLVVVFLMAASFGLGYVARRNNWINWSTRDRVHTFLARFASAHNRTDKRKDEGVPDASNWSQVETGAASSTIAEDQVEALNALGYLDAYEQPTAKESGVVYADMHQCFGGYRLYVSGHKPEARLITADGASVHSWSIPYARAFPNIPQHETYAGRFRRAYVYPDGALLAIFDLAGLVKLSVDSEIEWTHSGKSHHDMHVQPNGDIYIIDSAMESIPEQETAIIDYITHLSGDGEVLSRISIYECFQRSPYAALLTHVPKIWDIMHTNTLHILDDREKELLGPVLSGTGRVTAVDATLALVSCRQFDTIALVDLDRRAVVWALTGMWKAQHEPVITDRGTILVFDNRSLVDWSRLVDVNPSSQAVVWEYAGSPKSPFRSAIGGSIHLLPNGNIFVVETTRGRAFELTREKKIVWEFLSPHRIQRGDETLVANLYDMVPLAAEEVPFLSQRANDQS